MKTDRNPLQDRGMPEMTPDEADTVYGILWEDERFNTSLMRFLHDETMLRMDLILDLESRAEAILECIRRER